MKNKIKAFAVLILFSAVSFVSAEGYRPKAPKKGHILVVGSVSYKKPIDIKAREEAFAEKKLLKIGKTYDFSMTPDFSNKLFDTVAEGYEGYFYHEMNNHNIISSVAAVGGVELVENPGSVCFYRCLQSYPPVESCLK